MPSARSRASSIPTSRASPTPNAASARSPRRTRCSPIPSAARRTTASARPGSRRRLRAGFADFGSLSDIFAAFFGEDLLGGGGRRGSARSAVATCRPSSRSSSRRRSQGHPWSCRSTSPFRASAVLRRAPRPGTSTRACPTCAGAGHRAQRLAEHLRAVRPAAHVPRLRGRGRGARAAVRRLWRRGSGRCAPQLDVEIPKGIHDGQQIRVRGEGHAGFRSAERGNAFVVVRVRPDPRFVRDGDDLHTAVRLTMTDAALGTTATVASLTGDVELEVPAGTQPGEVRVLDGRGDAVAARAAPRIAVRAARRRGADVLDEEQRGLLEDVDRTLGPGGLRAEARRGRGVLRSPEERVALSVLRRVAVRVPTSEAEIAAARLARSLLRRVRGAEIDDRVELAVYTDAAGEEELRAAFPDVRAEVVEPGWEDRWKEFHRPVRAGGLWIGPPWIHRRPTSLRWSSTRGVRSARVRIRRHGPASSCSRSSNAGASSTRAAARGSLRWLPRGSGSRPSTRSISTRSPSRSPARPRVGTMSWWTSFGPTCCATSSPRRRRRREHRARARRAAPRRVATRAAVTSGYLESEMPAASGWMLSTDWRSRVGR